jgi:DNA polymerase I-like protein with 3'-5' exonuclease and polymerase domains
MEGVITLDVPLIADVSAGPNWQDVTELEIK